METKPNEMLFVVGIFFLISASFVGNLSWSGKWWVAIPLMVFAIVCAIKYIIEMFKWLQSKKDQ